YCRNILSSAPALPAWKLPSPLPARRARKRALSPRQTPIPFSSLRLPSKLDVALDQIVMLGRAFERSIVVKLHEARTDFEHRTRHVRPFRLGQSAIGRMFLALRILGDAAELVIAFRALDRPFAAENMKARARVAFVLRIAEKDVAAVGVQPHMALE